MTAAGWYENPENAAEVRYWDGEAWTSHTQPKPDADLPAAEPDDEPTQALSPVDMPTPPPSEMASSSPPPSTPAASSPPPSSSPPPGAAPPPGGTTPPATPSPSSISIPGIDILRSISSGGTADVYLGHQAKLNRDVAVKVIRGDITPATADRFRAEQAAMGMLSEHQGIVTVYESGVTASGQPFIVMPHLPGSIQEELNRRGKLEPDRAVDTMGKAAEAVQFAHTNGVLHRDIKPANIMRSRTGDPMVTDFGIAEVLGSEHGKTGGMALTPLYAAPELLDGGPATVASDVYALGATTFALLNGRAAYADGSGSIEAVRSRVNQIALPQLPSSVPNTVADVVRAAMAKDPTQRPASALDFANQLRAALATPSTAAATPVVASQGAPPPGADAAVTQDMGQHYPAAGAAEAAAPAAPAAPELDPFGRPVVAQPEPQSTPSRAPMVAALVALLAVGAAAIWWFAIRDDGSTSVSNPPTEQNDGDGGDDTTGGTTGDGTDAATAGTDGGTTDTGGDTAADGSTDGDADTTTDTGGPTPTPLPDLDIPAIAAARSANIFRVDFAGCGVFGRSTAVLVSDGQLVARPAAANAGWITRAQPLTGGAETEVSVEGINTDGQAVLSGADLGPAPSLVRTTVVMDERVALLGDDGSSLAAIEGVVTAVTPTSVTLSTSGALTPGIIGAGAFNHNADLVGVVTGFSGQSVTLATEASGGASGTAEGCTATPGTVRAADAETFSEDIEGFRLVQELADALADEEWDRVRTLEPTRSSTTDATFVNGWGPLEVSTPYPVSFGPSGGQERWRLLLVTHEFDNDNDMIMRHFCVSWDVDRTAGTLKQTAIDTVVLDELQGWNDQADSLGRASQC